MYYITTLPKLKYILQYRMTLQAQGTPRSAFALAQADQGVLCASRSISYIVYQGTFSLVAVQLYFVC